MTNLIAALIKSVGLHEQIGVKQSLLAPGFIYICFLFPPRSFNTVLIAKGFF
jgi:hypothetical protein